MLSFWNHLSYWLKCRGLKGMRQTMGKSQQRKLAISAASQRIQEYGYKIVRQAIYNYYRMWLYPDDQRRWTYTLWGLGEFCGRGKDNISRFMDWNEVKTNFIIEKEISKWDRKPKKHH